LYQSSLRQKRVRALECQEFDPSGEVVSQFRLEQGSPQPLFSGATASVVLERRNAVLTVQLPTGSSFSVSRPGRFGRNAFLQVTLSDLSAVRCEKAK